MPLPASGEISASQVGVELGRSSTAEHSFQTAHGGSYATLNTDNPTSDRPDGSTPYSISEFYSYDHLRGDHGVIAGLGTEAVPIVNIDKVTITTTGNASDFGDTVIAAIGRGTTSNGVNERAVFCGGNTVDGKGNATYENEIDYITINSMGNASDFGDLEADPPGRTAVSACSNKSDDRGIIAGGFSVGMSTYRYNIISYITISTTGNAGDFGDLSAGRSYIGATSNGTDDRGVFAGGEESGGETNVIEYITITSAGNASDFGDLNNPKKGVGATSNGTDEAGIFGGGINSSTGEISADIEKITISTTGNASADDIWFNQHENDTRCYVAGFSNGQGDRGMFAGGRATATAEINNISYITVSTRGGGADFGDLTNKADLPCATSDAG